jgi:hypothetical protein
MNKKKSSNFKFITKKNHSFKRGFLNKIKERMGINLYINKKIEKKQYKKINFKKELEKKYL